MSNTRHSLFEEFGGNQLILCPEDGCYAVSDHIKDGQIWILKIHLNKYQIISLD
jgi:hypothetical protein